VSIIAASMADMDCLSPLIAKFRVELESYKNIQFDEDLESARKEFLDYIKYDYPIFIYKKDNLCRGYLVCRVEKPVVWVESLYVLKEYRRNGIASALYDTAEQLAVSYGEKTLYNYVHPNNDAVIAFLNKMEYNVLNLIEVRKQYENEIIHEVIKIRNNEFKY
jgi:ribosomal protein S18 acetylase RimI-like enzyme